MPPAAPAPRRRDADATRAALLVAARRRFVVLGYDRTTTRAVADDAGVNVALISRYFGSKDGLYAAVLAESADLLADEAESVAPGDGRRHLVERVLAGLRPDAWPAFDHTHPLLLFVRDAGADPDVDRLRRESLLAGVAGFERLLGPDTEGDAEDAADPTDPTGPADARRRAELAMAVSTGLVVLRDLLGDALEITHDEDALRRELDRLLEHLGAPSSPAPTSPVSP